MNAYADRLDKTHWRITWPRKTRNLRKIKERQINPVQVQNPWVRVGRLLSKAWELTAVCDGGLLAIVLCIMFCVYITTLAT